MDSSQNASFIPKSPVRGTVNKRRVRKVYVFTYLIYLFFIGTLIASGLTWFYLQSVNKSLENVKLSLENERANFKPEKLLQVNDFDARLKEVSRLLNQQVSLGNVFSAIEQTTLRSVILSGFQYKKGDNALLTLDFTARANDFNATLFQREVISANPILTGAKLTDVVYASASPDKPGAGGQVNFSIEKELNPAVVGQSQLPNQSAAIIAPEAPDSSLVSEIPVENSDVPASDSLNTTGQ